MRLCFYNPHAVYNSIGITCLSRLAQIFGTNKENLRIHNLKYAFLLSFLQKNDPNTAIVVDGTGASLGVVLQEIPLLRNSYLMNKIISYIEIYAWCLINKVNPFKQTIIFDENKLNSKNDILFSFAFNSYSFRSEKLIKKSIIKSFTGKKILHASHFYKSTKAVAENIKKVGIRHMVAEADLKKSPYFNKFFGFIKQVYILPHVLRDKYINIKKFESRKNKCLALGTLVIESESDSSNKDYIDFFKTNTLHPVRKILYENKVKLADIVDCFINFHNKERLEKITKGGTYSKNSLFRMVYDLFFLSEGKEYHKMDIVKKYNEYKMFIAPEENIGLSSVNSVEGMACGCAYIGIKHPMYSDLGMIDKKHYIAYDGSLLDLQKKIKYYQIHQKELTQIATNGCEFARKNFSENKVRNDFWNYLTTLLKTS
ncbi:hypothetical protein A3G67_03070 [Candidatus Roizmanbacteria bacterium RIFCSPLOWO2_12_FULL_40_12]|uniref:Glycosyl transferase family 1 domain-containing protein n=1 Tax=Candidatus Roizmanbacteria bacterium RIFCSPLOWO2_01_FULL_40_42 TaxID=1802066 RepID=A0A1F7J5D1_9BACT|nr:MAG: hypothetical protein A2779_02705 [Candidatus Roizmanbacteria bacterium RIFCSPHIGHO2_01_FULL_40_98]OGK28255.1 MAG: hypothetical protein A3C31_00070 [Candidatus Roizmanbacteria bacterium RIFCSPHIGHO2_02_FULL_40_53]OGK30491.1 MAG: hypothetical protein A2W49_02755 [Candidatus Roizmanbacteria bacterium RIFCSPHIGHO2_12_41_18]OGK36905.1 MAG: hypothetical protein A3E69_00330 [Candidatus Roizmanbacteria bacterium RIFCSPHIGHO2_12_FULL_40_130]OGK50811.1 MAG: hypothetical protein A3B50_00840 [Candi